MNIRVPCSSANLGPGFDVLGIALQLYLKVRVTRNSTGLKVSHKGEGEGQVPLNEENMIVKAATETAKRLNKTLPTNLTIDIDNEIPLTRGFGSSAAAIVAGVLLANKICDLGLSGDSLLAACVLIEGHPDNVSPALLGGCVVCCMTNKELGHSSALPVPLDPLIRCVLVVPSIAKKSTAEARRVLPDSYSRADVIFNLQRVGTLIAGLGSVKNTKALREAMKDVVHQPYRAQLVPGLTDILELNKDLNLQELGLIGISLSGAGPSILCLVNSTDDGAKQIGQKVSQKFIDNNIQAVAKVLCVDHKGAVVEDI